MTTSHIETLPTSQPQLETAPAKTADDAWRPLYRIGGAAALTLIAFVVLAIIVFFINPPPTTVIGYFTLFQKNTLLGLLALDLMYMISQVLMGLILLALCVALRRASPSCIAIALTSGLVGLAVYFASNPAFGMLSLSSHYTAATNDVQRAQFEAAGQAIMANYTGTAYVVRVMGLVPASFGTVGLVFAFGSLVPTVIWMSLIARRLFQLGQGGS